jgi:hypothetical protein
MQTNWSGMGLPIANVVVEEVLIGKSLSLLLSDTPGTVTKVNLPATTQGVKIRTLDAAVWYALDAVPGPIPPPLPQTIIPDTAFVLGDVVSQGELAVLALPDDSLVHALYLLSEASGPWVGLTALVEMP